MRFLFSLVRFFLHRRYRVNLSGMDVFDTDSPVVVFPNHPALVDPMIMMSEVAQKKILSPVITETYIHTPGLAPILKKLKAVPVGDIVRGGSIEDVKSAFVGIQKAIEDKQNILIYPSGHIYVQSFEDTMGKKMAYEIVGLLPQGARIIVACTKGLWGSMWGKAYTGTSPELMKVLIRSIWYIIANLVFFVPKRDVSIEYRDMTEDLKKWHAEGLDAFNKHLQDYYNEGGNEPCRFVPHYAYYDDVKGKTEPQKIKGSLAELAEKNDIRESDIDPIVLARVYDIVAKVKKIDVKEVKFPQNLVLDLHADSLDMAEMKAIVQKEYKKASNPPVTLLKTVGDLAGMAVGILRGEDTLPPVLFPKVGETFIEGTYHEGDTILSRAMPVFDREKDTPFIYDAVVGGMTRDTFLMRAYVVSTYIKRFHNKKSPHRDRPTFPPGGAIGIMMPALASTSLLLFSTYLAKKLPVMLNWTVGEKSFAHCMEFAGLDTILTSRKFYEKIQTPWLAAYESKMVFVEDIVKDLSLMTKVTALIRKKLHLIPKIAEDAVMLFTSGSESLPKAVLLTHKNLLTDMEGALALVPFHEHETIIGFLPPFHSFGFTINTLLPLVAPVSVTYTPDPADARTIGKLIAHAHASIVSATPTFLRMILSGNPADVLASLRYAFVGAEKCGDDVFSLFTEKCPDGTILEGYGITECSPIVTVNPIKKQKKGSAGVFLPSLTPRIRSLEGAKDVLSGEQGMIYVSGPSIFGGYLDEKLESPFEEFSESSFNKVGNGDFVPENTEKNPQSLSNSSFQKELPKWYKTGDLGYIDKEGYLFITGRLKRFVKIAGEMISLPFIETILLEKYGKPDITTLAVEALEEEGVVTLIAFTTFDVSADELNEYIHTHGASNLVKIEYVEKIDMIPLLGSGKTDYKLLKGCISEILKKK